MRLSEDVIRYLTVKQEGPLPTPRSSNKGSNQSEKKEIESIDSTNKSESKEETNDKITATSETTSSQFKESQSLER